MRDEKKLTDAERAFEEYIAKGIPKPRRKAIVAEVGTRMFEAVRAKPEKLRLVAEDEHGNAVIDRPYRPRNPRDDRYVPDGPSSAVGQIKWGHNPFTAKIGSPFPAGGVVGRGDEFVQRNYDIYACLRENDDE
jgi:hypothetical protein